MSISLTSKFFANARGLTISDGGGIAWTFNKNTNTLTATGSSGAVLSSVGFADTSGVPIYTVTNSPLTANGTIDITLNAQTKNLVFSGPTTGANAQPTFRAMVVADLPTGIPNANLANTNVTISAGTGLTGGGVATLGGAAVTLSLVVPVTIANGGTGQITAAAAYNALSPMSTLGDIEFESAANTASRLAGNTSATKQFLTQTGTGTVSAAPVWGTIAAGDLPANGANPTAKVALAAVNGVATTWMRSDGAPALDVTISPTWTGNHTFTPTAAVGVTINAKANSYGLVVNGSSTSAQSFGIEIFAGTTSADAAFRVVNQAVTANFFELFGDGHGFINDNALSWTSTNNFAIAAPTGGSFALSLPAGTATVEPLLLHAGTNLTSAVAGATEYDGTNYYFTNEVTSGRGLVPVEQIFHLADDGGGITTIANFFGTTSNISLVSGGYYEIEIVCFFVMGSTGSVITWSLINSAAPTSMDTYFEMCPVTGVVVPPGTATALVGQIVAGTAATTTVVTTSLTASSSQYARFRIMLKNGTGTSLKIQVAETTTTTALTPKIGSYWKCKRIPAGNVGTFAA